MYTTEQFEQLEREEYSLTEEALTALLLTLGVTQKELETELRKFYQEYGKDGVVTYQEARKWVSNKDHRRRLLVLFAFISNDFDTTFDDFNIQFKNHLKNVVLKEIEFFELVEDDLDIDDILFTTWGVDDLNWEQRLLVHREKWVNTIANDLKTAFIKKTPIKTVLSNLDKRFVSMEKILWRLYITETTAVGSLARREIFKKKGIKKYQFFANGDEITCEHCGSLHGTIFPISAYEVGVTASPIHSYCRCWEIPILE